MSAREIIAKEILEAIRVSESTRGYAEARHQTADTILAALAKAGFKFLAREPTSDMVQAAILTHVRENKGIEHAPYLSWIAMFDAAPGPERK